MKDNKKNAIPDRSFLKDEEFKGIPGVKPFTKYRAIELVVCGFAVVLGLLYLYADMLSLAILLPLYCLVFAAVTVLRYLDTKAVGLKGFAAMLPVFCWGFLTCAVIVATAAYFVQQG